MYVIFEGGDGAGKDTQADLLWKKKPAAMRINEPDSSLPTGKLLREFLKSGDHPKAHAALFLADRMAMMYAKVMPALDQGTDVICVRSFLSTIAYQQEHWPKNWLFDIHRMLPCKANFIFLLDVDPAEGLKRVGKRGVDVEVYEKLEIQQRIRQRYLDIAKDPRMESFLTAGGKVIVLDTNGKTPEEVHEQVMKHLGG